MLNQEVHSVTPGAGCRDSGKEKERGGKTENKIIQLLNEEQGRWCRQQICMDRLPV